MFRKIVLFGLLALLLPVLSAAADESASKAQPTYQPSHHYKGIYVGARLYQLDARTDTWLAHRQPPVWKGLRCRDAAFTLREKGIWTGNLSERGECYGYEEAPTFATGNYLNFLFKNRSELDENHASDKD